MDVRNDDGYVLKKEGNCIFGKKVMVINDLINLRQSLHQHPELSGQEHATAARISEYFKHLNNCQVDPNIGGHGVVITFDSRKDGLHLAFRCELDALPIHEVNEISYRSRANGISHKCGHDGHMAIITGLGMWLNDNLPPTGKVSLIYQPAEEIGIGARAMLEDPNWIIEPDEVYALHNLPGYPMHQILYFPGQITPTVLSMAIRLKGITSHASEPQKGNNPTIAISKIALEVDKLNNINKSDPTYRLITPVHMYIGTKDYGISPGSGEIHFTMRTHDQLNMDILVSDITDIIELKCQNHGLDHSITYSDFFPSVENNNTCLEKLNRACTTLNYSIFKLDQPLPFGEDFGFIARKYKGILFGLGSGVETPPLHHETYDFPDKLIETGINIFKSIITSSLKK
ncbi:MAG: amidohydrolase [Saprospiraceae bacterium]|nr:amidohydrolase [Saprospiraceae bacterium]